MNAKHDTRQDYDDRLEAPPHGEVPEGDVDALMHEAKGIARELGVEDAPEYVCGACIRETPLAMSSARDVPKAKRWRNLCDAVSDVLEAWGEDSWWTRDELSSAYRNAYRNSAAEPGDCEVCNDESIPECGHEQQGEPCPAGG